MATGRTPSSSPAWTSTPGATPASSEGGATPRGARDTVCAFWLGARCYGISTSLVGEVYAVEDVIPVPLAPPAVVGLFSLRGAPVALVDSARVLELPGQAVAPAELAARGARATIALVIRKGTTLLAGLRIDRMDSVVGLDQGTWSPRDWAAEHAAVSGFLELPERQLVVTLFDTQAVVDRLHALRYR